MDSKRIKSLLEKARIVLILIVLCAVIGFLAPTFFTAANLINIVRQISIICIIAMGSMMVIITGGIDLSPGSIAAFSGVVGAILATTGGFSPLAAIFVGILAGGICGLVNGVIVAKGKIPSFIVTLGMSEIARGLAYILSNGKPVSGLPKGYLVIGRTSIGIIPVPIIIMAAVLVITWIIMKKLTIGKHIYAVGGNPVAARVAGIHVDRVLIMVYAFAGLTAGLGGLVLSARIASGHPNNADGYELDAIAATVIGGTSLSGGIGSVWGTLIGALIIGVLNNGLDILSVSSYYQQVAKGVIIIVCVLMDRKTSRSS